MNESYPSHRVTLQYPMRMILLVIRGIGDPYKPHLTGQCMAGILRRIKGRRELLEAGNIIESDDDRGTE